MVCKTTSIDSHPGHAAYTLVEVMTALSIMSVLVIGGFVHFSLYAGQALAAIYNYTDLDSKSQIALDSMTRELRQMDRMKSWGTTTLNGQTITNMLWLCNTNYLGQHYHMTYTYNPNAQTLTEFKENKSTGVNTTKTLLEQCTYFNFSLYQRNTISNTFDQFPHATGTNTLKLVLLNWTCRRTVYRSIFNTESVQSMRVVIRRK